MYRCSRCGSDIDDGFDRCWNCAESVTNVLVAEETTKRASVVAAYRMFRGPSEPGESHVADAAAFATSVGRENVITISQSSDRPDGVVTVWFWDDVEPRRGDDVATLDPG